MQYQSKEEARIHFYRVSQVGYYKYGSGVSEFCSLRELLTQLQNWATGKTVEQSALFVDSDDAEQAPVYILDVHQSNGNFLVATWNASSSNNGKAAFIAKSAKVGNAKPSTSKIPKDNIPGFATYFWFVPSEGVFATVRLSETSLNGQKGLQRYLEQFLHTVTSFVRKATGPEPKVLGYSIDEHAAPANLFPRFRTEPFVKPGVHQKILNSAPNIRKVMRKTKLNLSTVDDRDLWQRIIQRTQFKHAANSSTKSVPIEYEIATRVTVEEVQAMIDNFVAHGSTKSEDYGFVLSGSAEQLWLSRSWAKGDFMLTFTRIDDHTVDSGSLLSALESQKVGLLSIMK